MLCIVLLLPTSNAKCNAKMDEGALAMFQFDVESNQQGVHSAFDMLLHLQMELCRTTRVGGRIPRQ